MSKRFLNIALPTPLLKTFTYYSNEQWNGHLPGTRVYVPFGRRFVVGVFLSELDSSDLPESKIKRIIKVLDDQQPSLTASIMRLCRWSSEYYQHSLGEVFNEALPRKLRVISTSKTKQYQLTALGQSMDISDLGRAKAQKFALQSMRDAKQELVGSTFLKKLSISNAILKQLEAKKLVKSSLVDDIKTLKSVQIFSDNEILEKNLLKEQELDLNEEQAHAVNTIEKNCLNTFKVSLIDGVTGSGKTEVYLQIIKTVLQQNKQVLLLVPEIGLTPQTMDRFIKRFNVEVVQLHSKLSDLNRLESWQKARTAQARIVVGTRSAIFVPMPKLALIIVDEEHDSSFKQYDGFHYSARDLAIVRGQFEQIPVLLGSATPSLESYYNTFQQKFSYFNLSRRAGSAAKPTINLVDPDPTKSTHEIAPSIILAIKDHLAANNQVLVFINKRGFAPVLACNNCQWIASCKHCDAHLNVHKVPAQLKCHHCDSQSTLPSHCPECSSDQLYTVGLGTQKSESILANEFKSTPIIRIDRDNMVKRDAFKNTVDYINQGESCILVGTQMLAKGHHFPNVTLVVVLNVDQGFYSMDFRGFERTGQLLTQVAGRAGRGDKRGEVYIQSKFTNDPRLHILINQPYIEFAKLLLQEREIIEWPPYSYLALIRADAKSPDKAMSFLRDLYHFIQHSFAGAQWKDTINVHEPMTAMMEKRAGRYRALIMMQSEQRKPLRAIIKTVIGYLTSHTFSGIRWSIDIDPQEIF